MHTPNDPVDRVIYWWENDANRIATLYLTAAALGLASVLSYIFGGTQRGGANDLQLGLLLLAGLILFYMAISGMGHGGE